MGNKSQQTIAETIEQRLKLSPLRYKYGKDKFAFALDKAHLSEKHESN